MHINHLDVIRSYWDEAAEEYHRTHPEHLDESMHPSWGLWHVPEKDLCLFEQSDLKGKRMLDLGCGRGHDAVAYAKLGAQVLAIDISEKQLKAAFPHKNVEYVHAPAEKVPAEYASIDIAISDHGAFDHAPAHAILEEMNRVLIPGGQLIICTYSPISYACYDEKTGCLVPSLLRNIL